MSKFQVGEIAIITYSRYSAHPVGTEVRILEVLEDGVSPMQYCTDRCAPDGQYIWGCDLTLRKKPPQGIARQPLGKWSECPWRPGVVPSVEEMNRRIKHGFAELDRCIKRGLEHMP